MTPEEQPLYDEHVQSYFDLYQPIGHPEQVLVQCIAGDYWRALRGRALQDAHLRQALEDPGAPAALDHEKSLGNLSLYVQRLERSIKNNVRALQDLQAQRKEAQRKAEEEAKLLAQANRAMGLSSNPAQDSQPQREFVFSSPQLVELASRRPLRQVSAAA